MFIESFVELNFILNFVTGQIKSVGHIKRRALDSKGCDFTWNNDYCVDIVI